MRSSRAAGPGGSPPSRCSSGRSRFRSQRCGWSRMVHRALHAGPVSVGRHRRDARARVVDAHHGGANAGPRRVSLRPRLRACVGAGRTGRSAGPAPSAWRRVLIGRRLWTSSPPLSAWATSPDTYANTTTRARSRASSLDNARDTRVLAVAALITSRSANAVRPGSAPDHRRAPPATCARANASSKSPEVASTEDDRPGSPGGRDQIVPWPVGVGVAVPLPVPPVP